MLFLRTLTLSFVPTVIPVDTEAVGIEVTAVPLVPTVTPVTTASPVPVVLVAPVATVTATPTVATLVESVLVLVTTDPPAPDVDKAPVATVLAVPSVTLEAVKSVPKVVLVAVKLAPKVGATLLAPLIINVSESSPLPIVKVHVEADPALVTFGIETEVLPVTFGIVTSVFPVTLGTVVVTNLLVLSVTELITDVAVPAGVIDVVTKFFPVSAVTDLTKVSVEGVPKVTLPLVKENVVASPNATSDCLFNATLVTTLDRST